MFVVGNVCIGFYVGYSGVRGAGFYVGYSGVREAAVSMRYI